MMYKNTTMLDSKRHKEMTVSADPAGFSFAADQSNAQITLSEFYNISNNYPIVFLKGQNGSVQPVALLGADFSENLFIDQEGKWTGKYLPAYLRRYPFITTAQNGEQEPLICFDEDFGGFNIEGGAPLFEDGAPTQKLQEIQQFLRQYLLEMQETVAFSAKLMELGLLQEQTVTLTFADGSKKNLTGFLGVDEQKLKELSDIDVLELFRNGTLQLVYAHLLSFRNFQELAERKFAKLTSAAAEVEAEQE